MLSVYTREKEVNLLNINFKSLLFLFQMFFPCSCLKVRIPPGPVFLSAVPQ